MRRLRFVLAVTLALVTALLVAGCGGSDPDAAKTPAGAQTITNGQPPTDEGGGGEDGGGEGDVAAGKTAFEGKCQGCHADGGATAASGPVLKDKGLKADAIRNQVVNGGGGMPGGLVSGADLDNVVAFVSSIQGEAAEAPSGGSGGGDDAAVAAGKTFFEGTCQGCHTDGGTKAGAGPILAGTGLAEDRVRSQIENGGGGMPGGLASGDDLKNVVKFVLSLQ